MAKKRTNKNILLTSKEKREMARKAILSGNKNLPLNLFEANHPELVETDSSSRISPLGLKYRTGKHIKFKETVKNFAEEFDRLCGYNESCLDWISQDYGDFCLFGSKPCVIDQAQKKVLKKYQESESKVENPDFGDDYYREQLAILEKEEIPF